MAVAMPAGSSWANGAVRLLFQLIVFGQTTSGLACQAPAFSPFQLLDAYGSTEMGDASQPI